MGDLKELALRFRLAGKSYREIEVKLGVARSTLSGWLKNVSLSLEQREDLRKRWLVGTALGRMRGSAANHLKKLDMQKGVDGEVKSFISNLPIDRNMLELFLAGLYLGDGFKVNGRVGLGNANPRIVLLFVQLLRNLYNIDEGKLRAQIFARLDQREEDLIAYWSRLLRIGPSRFHKTQFDIRTIKKPTRDDYHGVCSVVISDTRLQRRILAIGAEMIEFVGTLKRVRSSVG